MSALPEVLMPLTALNHWVVWRLKKMRNGKFTKPPYQPDGRLAESDDPHNTGSPRGHGLPAGAGPRVAS
jgi:hypothetical protein